MVREDGDDVIVKLEDLSKIKPGAPKGDSTVFVIQTLPMGWKANRTFKDFQWLYKCLSSKYPNYYVSESN